MSTFSGKVSTISGKCQLNQENKCQPLQEKAKKLSTKIRKRHLRVTCDKCARCYTKKYFAQRKKSSPFFIRRDVERSEHASLIIEKSDNQMIRFFEHRLLGLHGYDFQEKQEKPFHPFLSYRSPCAAGAACRKQDSAIHPHRHTGIACLAKSMQEKPKKPDANRMGFFSAAGFFFPEALPSEGSRDVGVKRG
ncbi:MAG: hypothetical protein J6T94_00550 [Bacteroidaceae bacterium]|nr:hypothetical protein [Bacteroidaceae bacterium]